MSDPIPVCDPHFHLWDLAERANPNLGDPPPYKAADYFADMATLPHELKRVAGELPNLPVLFLAAVGAGKIN